MLGGMGNGGCSSVSCEVEGDADEDAVMLLLLS